MRWIVQVEDLEELGTTVGLERLPRVFGETERSLDQAVSLISITDLARALEVGRRPAQALGDRG